MRKFRVKQDTVLDEGKYSIYVGKKVVAHLTITDATNSEPATVKVSVEAVNPAEVLGELLNFNSVNA